MLAERPEAVAVTILLATSVCHMLNDIIQSLMPAIYPLLKDNFALDFGQIGLITFVFQVTASLLQPVVGQVTDRRPQPFSLPIGMGFTLVGLLLLAFAPNYGLLLVAAALVGIGSSIFHPESSRVARMASGGRHGFAQSVFQVGGNLGSAIGPLLAAFIVVPYGQHSIAWFSLVALLGIVILWRVSVWYHAEHVASAARPKKPLVIRFPGLSPRRVVISVAILGVLVFSKYFYLTSITSYYTFYLIDRFGVSVPASQIFLFVFLFASAAGTFFGGPIGDRFGRKLVIWISILGVLPFTIMLPHAGLLWTVLLSSVIGLVMSSAFSTIVVFAHELVPGRIGMISGIFFGLAFGVAGVGAAILGEVADLTSITFIYEICAFLPAIGLITVFLPDPERRR